MCPDQEQQDPLLPLLTALAGQLQLELPSPQQGQLVELLPTQDGARAVADLQVGCQPDNTSCGSAVQTCTVCTVVTIYKHHSLLLDLAVPMLLSAAQQQL